MRLQSAVGFDAVKDTAVKLGIKPGPLDAGNVRAACFTIGCEALVTPLDMADAYGTIVNDGRQNPAHFVDRVTDRDGNVLFQFEPPNEQVISPESSRQAIVAMEGVISSGTCTRCALPGGRPAAGKTGTPEGPDGSNIGVVVRRIHTPAVHGGLGRRSTGSEDPPERKRSGWQDRRPGVATLHGFLPRGSARDGLHPTRADQGRAVDPRRMGRIRKVQVR